MSPFNWPVFTVSLLFLLFHSDVNADGHWNHDDQEIWSHISHDCSGVKQSPINIVKSATVVNESLAIQFHHYDSPLLGFGVVNNGHSVQFNFIGDASSQPSMTGSALNNEVYSLEQFHFHWGLKRGIGSEHTIDGNSYTVELHLVHYNRHRYESLSKALESHQGVAVLGILFEIERQDNPYFSEISRLVSLVHASNATVHPEEPIKLNKLLPNVDQPQRFYRYSGSLTTPPCTEGITWLVMADPNLIGLNQFEQFRAVVNTKTRTLVGNNYREIQSLRGRTVEASFDAPAESATTTITVAPSILFTMIATLTVLRSIGTTLN